MAIADNLIANESIEFQSEKHWMAPIRASGVFVLLLLGFALLRWLSPTGDGFMGTIGSLLDLIAWGLLIAGVVGIIYNIIAWRTAEFAVTNLRVIREEGLLKHRSSATLISSITDVQSKVGVLGRSLGYGDLVILSQSGQSGADRFMTITKTEGFRNAIMTRKMSGSTAQAPAPSAQRPRRGPGGARRRCIGRDRPRGGAQQPRRPPRPRRDHGRGVRGEEGRDPRPDVTAARSRPSVWGQPTDTPGVYPPDILIGSMSTTSSATADHRPIEIVLPIAGMTCASCVNRIERFLGKTDGVVEANVNLATERATVTVDPAVAGRAEVVAAISAAGYDVRPETAAASPLEDDPEDLVRQRERRTLLVEAVASHRGRGGGDGR